MNLVVLDAKNITLDDCYKLHEELDLNVEMRKGYIILTKEEKA